MSAAHWIMRKWLRLRGIRIPTNGIYSAKHGIDAGTRITAGDA